MKTVYITLAVSSFLLITTLVNPTLAQEIPDVVYRADSRDPSVIFESGFQSWGDDDNIISHVSGFSVGVFMSSNFVSTTASAEIAVKFLSFNQSHQTFWVYSIHPNNKFYSTNLSLQEIVNTSNDEKVIEDARDLISSQNEWLALRQIPPSQIISAVEYRNNRQQPVPTGRVLTNNRYYPDNTTPNATPYVARGRPTTTENVYLVNGTVGLAVCNNGVRRDAPSSKDVDDDYIGTCDNPIKVATETYVEVSKDTYWDYWTQGTCNGDYRDYTARLMNIQGSWEDTCQIAPVNVEGVPFIEGRKCENSFNFGTLIHGEYATFRVHDYSCSNTNISQAHFVSTNEAGDDKGCRPSGQLRRYEARLWNITGSWEVACSAMPFIIKGKYFPAPSACINHGGAVGEYGYFDVHDATCPE